MHDIGKEIKNRREAAGMTQEELAKKIQVNQSMVANVEAGRKMASVWIVKMAAEAFGCTTDALIYGKRESA